jgi:hypothetical protein
MVIAVALGIDIPNQTHLLTGLAMRGKKAAAIHVLIE